MLRVENLMNSFGDFRAVDGANLAVEKGKIVAVIGPNGAGKTTLFNLITGHLKPEAGKIIFKGEDITGLPPYTICKKGIARSFQLLNIFPRLTVFDNVQVAVLSQHNRSLHLFRPAKNLLVAETNHILENVGLLGKSQKIAGSLSQGDQKILEIAIALGNEPEFLILDEPTAGMSAEETTATMALVKRLAVEQGLTLLFCEHDIDIVFSMADRIMVMQQGKTIIEGTPDEVRQNEQVQQAYMGGS
ncbi:MAG: ABC transporter ATP-binding protein [Deltaproteobacteria bacterium]|nr:ABC transporter ATP-binding protein [Deltaproteobacteria bacterium]